MGNLWYVVAESLAKLSPANYKNENYVSVSHLPQCITCRAGCWTRNIDWCIVIRHSLYQITRQNTSTFQRFPKEGLSICFISLDLSPTSSYRKLGESLWWEIPWLNLCTSIAISFIERLIVHIAHFFTSNQKRQQLQH